MGPLIIPSSCLIYTSTKETITKRNISKLLKSHFLLGTAFVDADAEVALILLIGYSLDSNLNSISL